jgi:4-amino-4-deoxy-L-arabinose transferase-like glycosyltransferase
MKNKELFVTGFFLLLIYILGFQIDIMDIDAAQYASISREMLSSGNYLKIYDLGKDYLDKPPFLFWISAFFMKVFGVNNFSYRLPSFLFALIAIVSTFRFSKLYYDYKTALLAALILATTQGFFLMNHDVRTDTILMGAVSFSIWQLACWYQQKKIQHFILGCVGIAVGMMTKGPIALMIPIFAFGTHFILIKDFKFLFKWQYLLGVIIIAILLLPMSIGLYQQFDLHPEKIMYNKTHVSGIRFFYWTQSFGRITGESTWNNNANIFFLLQNMMWSFLPWIIIFLTAFINKSLSLFHNRFKPQIKDEVITYGGFLLTYLSLGMSKYQLPHYIFVAFPFASIITADYLTKKISDLKSTAILKKLSIFHFIVFSLLWILLIALLGFTFETIHPIVAVLALILFAGFVFFYFKQRQSKWLIVYICLYTAIGLNLFLNSSFYPAILNYQAGSNAGKWISKNNIPVNNVFTYQYEIWRSLDFYANGIIQHKDSVADFKTGEFVLTTKNKLSDFDAIHKSFTILHNGNDFPVTKLSLNFINPKTREQQLNKFVLIKIK